MIRDHIVETINMEKWLQVKKAEIQNTAQFFKRANHPNENKPT